jgi:hypothetical protein
MGRKVLIDVFALLLILKKKNGFPSLLTHQLFGRVVISLLYTKIFTPSYSVIFLKVTLIKGTVKRDFLFHEQLHLMPLSSVLLWRLIC